jgi:hypothetical protein
MDLDGLLQAVDLPFLLLLKMRYSPQMNWATTRDPRSNIHAVYAVGTNS